MISTRTQILLTLNLLTTLVALIIGWQSMRVATKEIEKRLVEDSVSNAADLIAELKLPLSNRLMDQLATVLNCEMAAFDQRTQSLLASSFPAGPPQAALVNALSNPPVNPREWVNIQHNSYRLGSAVVQKLMPVSGNNAKSAKLVVLLPETRIASARYGAARRIGILTVIAIAAATAVGFLLSATLTRPMRLLVTRMENISDTVARADNLADLEPAITISQNASQTPATSPAAATELKRLSKSFAHLLDQLRESYRRLDRAARLAASGQMSAGVAHELRNPLSSIKMNSRLLLDEPKLTEHSRQAVEIIFREIDRMDLYLKELMALSPGNEATPDNPLSKTQLQDVNLAEVADDVLAIFEERAKRKSVNLKRLYAESRHQATALADYDSLRQVIMNLVVNALDVAPAETTIEVKITDLPSNQVKFTIADQGSGFDDTIGENAFSPFVTTKPHGTGMGLFISQQIIQRFGGRIGSAVQNGKTELWFVLAKPEANSEMT
ncbi:MAG: histidine kinase dimerization/phospho-acceptor domain-containing protein [Lentisphaeria bacterium]